MYHQYSFIALVLAASRYEDLFPGEVELHYSEPEHELCSIEHYDKSSIDSIALR